MKCSTKAAIAARLSVVAIACCGAAGTAPSPALAQATASAGLEEIVVTARRREENLQSVPVSVTAFSDKGLQERRIETVADLQRYVPSLSSQGAQPYIVNMSIRGQGGFAPGGTSSVVTYFNEVPASLVGAGLYYDLQSLQVLKGPQGTLFGRNTTGGAVLFQTKRPTDQFEGHVQGTLGNFKDREIEGALNLPLVHDRLLVRLAGMGQSRGGYTHVQSTPSHPNGKNLDDRHLWSGRASIRVKPHEGITNDIIFDYTNLRARGTQILVAVNRSSAVPLLFPSIFQLFDRQQALGARSSIPLDNDPFLYMGRLGVTDILEWQIDDQLTFRNIFAWRREATQRNGDQDGTALRIFELGNHIGPLLTRQFTEEPQVQAKLFDGRLTAVAGAFYLKVPAENFSTEDRFTFGRPVVFQQRAAERTRALYAQGTYDLGSSIDGLKLTAGFRYTWDDRFLATRQLTAGVCNSPGSDAQCTLSGAGSFRAPTWTLGLDYQVAPDTLLYVTSRRGYRSGGFNPQSQLPEQKKFFPEYVTDVELGLKSDWNLGTVTGRTNLGAYYQMYDRVQLNHTVVQFGLPATVTENIAKATVRGLEFEGQLVPFRGMQVNLAYAWGAPNFDKFDPGTDPASIASYHWTNVPRHKITVGARYQLPLEESVGQIVIGGDLSWESGRWITTTLDAVDRQDPYALVNLNASWSQILGYPVDLSVFVNNATNRLVKSGSFSLFYSLGLTTMIFNEPRMYGARLRYRFGAEE